MSRGNESGYHGGDKGMIGGGYTLPRHNVNIHAIGLKVTTFYNNVVA